MPIADIDYSEYFPAAKLSALRENFDEADTSGDGHISWKELQTMFRKIGWNLNTKQIKEVIADVDYDESGMLEFEEYCVMLIKMQKLRPRADLIDYRDWLEARMLNRVRALWAEYDPQGVGTVDISKFDEMLRDLNCRAKSDFVDDTIRQALRDERRFDFEQLCCMWAVLGMGRKQINFREYLAPELVKKYRTQFGVFAKQANCLKVAQLDSLLRRLGYALSRPQLCALFTDFDEDGSGTIDFAEFCVMMARLTRARRKRMINPQTYPSCRPLWDEEGFDVGELQKCGFSLMDMRQVGIPVGKIFSQGAASALELRRCGYSSSELRRGGLSAASLRKCGFSLAELRNAGFSEDVLEEVNRSVKQSLSAGDLSCLRHPQKEKTVPPLSWDKMIATRCMTPFIRAHHDSVGSGASVASGRHRLSNRACGAAK